MIIGFIGLGKMGTRMVKRLLSDGHSVIVWNRSQPPIDALKSELSEDLQRKLTYISHLTEFKNLQEPRIIWSMLPAGGATKKTINEVSTYLSPKDILIDGGNTHFTDTQKNYETLKKKKIQFLGIGVSGGIHAEKNGYVLMVGGSKKAYERIQPILETLIKPHAEYAYLGEGGAGHFVKMVHNAIEYGMMQAIGEGFGIIQKSAYNLNPLQVAKIYQRGTIISSFLIDRTVDALVKDPTLENISGTIEATGEAEWAIEEAKKENVPNEIIQKSLEFRQNSKNLKQIQNSFAAKLISALRHEFGGHKISQK